MQSSDLVVPVSVSRFISIVRLALVTSVTWTPPFGPPVRFQMHHVSHVAEQQVAGLGLGARAVDVVEDPLDLRPGEVGRQRQAGLGAEAVLAAVLGELVDDHVGPRVLPDDRVVDGLAGVLVPDDRGLALVGDADGGEVRGGDAGLVERAADHFLACAPRSRPGRARPSPASDRSARAPSGRWQRPGRHDRRS